MNKSYKEVSSCNNLAAASSNNHCTLPFTGCTQLAGNGSPSLRIRCNSNKNSKFKLYNLNKIYQQILYYTFKISAFELPVAINAQYLALFKIGKVKVILLGGGFGESEIGATHTDVSSHNL